MSSAANNSSSAAAAAAKDEAQWQPPYLVNWLVGLSLVTVISSCAAVGIVLLPIVGPRRYKRLLNWFIGLGVGSLSGSAVFHLIPSAVDFDATTGTNPYLLWLLIAGVYVFYVLENVIRFVNKCKSYTSDSPSNPIATVCLTSVTPLVKQDVAPNGTVATPPSPSQPALTTAAVDEIRRSFKREDIKKNLVRVTSSICSHDHCLSAVKTLSNQTIAAVAWMIIIGDSVHNFIDGVSIGAAFTQNMFTGISISIAVLCEEFPHELGDVAVLIASGMTIKQALFYNLLSALTCYAGFVVGMLLGGIGHMDRMIFAFAGGMFLFISLGNMLPEMNAKVQAKMKKHPRRAVKLFVVQSSGVLVGLLCLFALAMIGDYIRI